MLGLMFLVGRLFGNVVGSQVEDVKNEFNKVNHANPNGFTYIDEKGRTRLISNNHRALYKKADKAIDKYIGIENGDYILVDIDDHWSLVHNFDFEKRMERLRAMDEKYEKFSTEPLNMDIHKGYYETIHGMRFLDKETGDEYVIRELSQDYPGCYDRDFFINVETGFYVRETDTSIVKHKEAKEKGYDWWCTCNPPSTIEELNQNLISKGFDTSEKRLKHFKYDRHRGMADYHM